MELIIISCITFQPYDKMLEWLRIYMDPEYYT